MNLPITSLLAGFMAIFIMALNVHLSIRQIHLGGDVFKNMSDGAGDDILIRRRIAFMSAVFNIPMSILLLGLIEYSAASRVQVIILALTLIVSRVLHVIGCLYETVPKIRTFAIMIQFGYFTVCGLWLMFGVFYLI
jgi:uncharacterized membrane protein YecN with MAPEG domain